MDKHRFVLAHMGARKRAIMAIEQAPDGYSVTISPPGRSTDQNAALWPILQAFSEQLKWPVNGAMVSMTAEEWKDVLTAAFERETVRLASGLEGGVVMLGQRTSKYSKKRFSEFLDYLHATAALRGVKLSGDSHEF
ncbi:MAG: recombination protein NinB [Casimicrobium sp.]